MATWKKVIVSGSNADLTSITSSVLTNDNLIIAGVGGALEDSGLTLTGTTLNIGANSIQSTGTDSILTGSFAGTFSGSVVVDLENLTQGTGIAPFTYDGNTVATVAVSGAAQLSSNAITKWNSTDGKFVDSSLTDNGTAITGTTSLQLSGANSSLTGSFTGSFTGDGSGLTNLTSDLNFSGSTGNGTVDLKTQTFTIAGTANEIETSAAGQTITIGLPTDVTIAGDLIVNNDLTVLGTASFQNTENLQVADRFILLASGSTTGGDGGFVVQQTTQDVGEVFGFHSSNQRWSVATAFTATASVFTPDAFMATVVVSASLDPNDAPAVYDRPGNIYVSDGDGSIYIYS
jgi:hypothetical protein